MFFIFSAFSILKSFRFSLSVIVLLENSSLFNSVKKNFVLYSTCALSTACFKHGVLKALLIGKNYLFTKPFKSAEMRSISAIKMVKRQSLFEV